MNRIAQHELFARDALEVVETYIQSVPVLEHECAARRKRTVGGFPHQDMRRLPVDGVRHVSHVAHFRVEIAVNESLTANWPPVPAVLPLRELRLLHAAWRVSRSAQPLVRWGMTLRKSIGCADIVAAPEAARIGTREIRRALCEAELICTAVRRAERPL